MKQLLQARNSSAVYFFTHGYRMICEHRQPAVAGKGPPSQRTAAKLGSGTENMLGLTEDYFHRLAMQLWLIRLGHVGRELLQP